MKAIASFESVSLSQFVADWLRVLQGTQKQAHAAYQALRMPQRATIGAAGYDFFVPLDITLAPQQSICIPTGVRVQMEMGWVLLLFPRSGLGFQYRLQLDNTVGVIDSDYYAAANEGHILIKVTNDSKEGKHLTIPQGKGFAQGVFLPFGVTREDHAENIRIGGFGSTT